MNLDYRRFIHLIFPPSADERCLNTLPDNSLLPFLNPQRLGDTTALLPYQNPYVRAAIHLNKFHHHPNAINLLAACIVATVHELDLAHTCFVPVPLAPARQRARGYNQVSSVLARAQKHDPRIVINERLIRRTHNTVPQTSLTRTARQTNVRHAFAPTPGRDAPTVTRYILVDDVLTTGATLTAAKHALRERVSGDIECLVLAH